MRRKMARANVTPIRQRTQFTCVSTSTCMALNALGVNCTEDQVNEVIGAKPMQGSRWEEVLACAQYFGCRATLTTPATLTQVKEWTDQGKPVLIAWNPEGRDWSHASLIFDVTGERGDYLVHVADPNIPNPDKTVREVPEDEFYSKWFEKWPNYLVRRPALMIDREICPEGKQRMASSRRSMSRFAEAQRVKFKGRDLSINTVESYASDPDHEDYDAAKSFLKKRKKKETNESWLDKKMDEIDKDYNTFYDSSLLPVKTTKNIAKFFSKQIPKPSAAFSTGFNQFANPTAENTKKIKDNVKHAVSEIFKDKLKEGEEEKVADCLVTARKSAMEALGEASKALADQTARFGISAMTGLTYAGLATAGKAVAGSVWTLGMIAQIATNPRENEEQLRVHRQREDFKRKVKERRSKKASPEDQLSELMAVMMGGFSKDEAKTIDKFISKDGTFDQKGYMREMNKAIQDIKKRAQKYVQDMNEKAKEEDAKKKSASIVALRYLNG
jgi:hypothetical protein